MVFKDLTSYRTTGKENCLETSELQLASNLSSSTQIETDPEHEEENSVRRSKI